jgi:hypothetical protein
MLVVFTIQKYSFKKAGAQVILLLRMEKKHDGNFGNEISFHSFALRICDYGTQRKNTEKGPRNVFALRHPLRFHGRYCHAAGHQ